MVDVESGFLFKPNLISKNLSIPSKCIGNVRFETKFDRFNSGGNLDVCENFGFNPEITSKYGLKPKYVPLSFTLVSTLNLMLNFDFNKRKSDSL